MASLYLEENSFAFCVGAEQFFLHICSTPTGKEGVMLKAVGVHRMGTC